MKRSDLLTILKAAAPALAAKPILPAFGHFCFTKNRVLAYDDVVAIQVPCEIPIEGGVPGAEFLSWLSLCRARDVDVVALESKTPAMRFKAGRASLTLTALPLAEYTFKMPSGEKAAVELPLTQELIEAFRAVTISAGTDPGHPWRLGATIKVASERTFLYSCDNFAVTRASAKGGGAKFEAVIAPRFLSLLLDFVKGEKKARLFLSPRWTMVRLQSGAALWSKTVGAPSIGQFTKLIEGLEAACPPPVDVPPGLLAALSRAEAVLAFAPDHHASFNFSEGRLRIAGDAPSGSFTDTIKLAGTIPGCSDRYLPAMVKRILPLSPRFTAIPAQGLVFRGPTFFHALSALVGPAGTDEEAGEVE